MWHYSVENRLAPDPSAKVLWQHEWSQQPTLNPSLNLLEVFEGIVDPADLSRQRFSLEWPGASPLIEGRIMASRNPGQAFNLLTGVPDEHFQFPDRVEVKPWRSGFSLKFGSGSGFVAVGHGSESGARGTRRQDAVQFRPLS